MAIVQDPDDALYASMPRSALAHVDVDHVLLLSRIGPVLARLAREQTIVEKENLVPTDMEMETKLAAMDMRAMHNEEHVGTPSVYSCPACHGVLWELHDGNLLRFRCRVGHAYSVDSILAGQFEAVEEALWAALKTLEESLSLSHRMAKDARAGGKDWLANRFEEKAREVEQHAVLIQQVLLKSGIDAALDDSAELVATEKKGTIVTSRDDSQNEE